MKMDKKKIVLYGGRQSGKQAQTDALKEILFTNGSRIVFSSDRPPLGQLKGDNPEKLWIWSEMI